MGEGGRTHAHGVLGRVSVKGMCLTDGSADPQGVNQGLPRHLVSVGPTEGHNRYH